MTKSTDVPLADVPTTDAAGDLDMNERIRESIKRKAEMLAAMGDGAALKSRGKPKR